MKKIVILFYLAITAAILITCSKKKTEDPVPQQEEKKAVAEQTKQSDNAGSSEADKAIEDVNDFLSNGWGGSNNTANTRVEAYNLPCGVIHIDSSASINGRKQYKLKYGNQTPCGYKRKSGEVSTYLVKGNRFSDPGADFSITFSNYKVIVLATNDSVTLNGTIIVTNVSGGHIWESVIKGSIIQHRLKGLFYITYNNGVTRPRRYYQLRTWQSSKSLASLTFTATGDSITGNKKISETGKTLEGDLPFITEISEDYVWGNCGNAFVLQKGHARLTVPSFPSAYFDVEAGFKFDLTSKTVASIKNCEANSYRVITKIGALEKTEYQLY